MKEKIIISAVVSITAAFLTDVYLTSKVRARMMARRHIGAMQAATIEMAAATKK